MVWRLEYYRVGDLFIGCDDRVVKFQFQAASTSIDLAPRVTPPGLEVIQEFYFYQAIPSGVLTPIYIVHYNFFLDYSLTHVAGMKDIYVIKDDRFLMKNTPYTTPIGAQLPFIDTWFSVTTFRFKLYQCFINTLCTSVNTGRMSFRISAEQNHFLYLKCNMESAVTRTVITNGNRVKVANRDSIASVIPKAELECLELSTIFDLQPLLGNNYWICPPGQTVAFGSKRDRPYNYINPINAGLSLNFDALINELRVSFNTVTGDGYAAVDGINNNLREQKERLCGKVLRLQDKEYYILDVEYKCTSQLATLQCRGPRTFETILIAWMIEYENLVTGEAVNEETLDFYGELDQLLYFRTDDIDEEDILLAAPLANQQRRKLPSFTYSQVVDVEKFVHNRSEFFYRSLCNPNYNVVRLHDDLGDYRCTKNGDLQSIFITDLHILVDLPSEGRSLMQFCNDVYFSFVPIIHN